MIKLDSYYDVKTASWNVVNKPYCKTKHKSRYYYTVDEVKSWGKGDWSAWDWTYQKPGDVALAPKLLSVWSK